MGLARDVEDSHSRYGYFPKLMVAGRLNGTFADRPVVITADDSGVTIDVSSLRSAWQLRTYVHSVVPVLQWMKAGHIPLTVRVGRYVSMPVLPQPSLLVKLLTASLTKS